MKMDGETAARRLSESAHGVLCTVDATHGVRPEPCVFASEGSLLAFAVEAIKERSAPTMVCETNLAADPRASLLVEQWDPEDWTKLWWVRAELRHVVEPGPADLEVLARNLSGRIEQFEDRPFDRLVVLEVVAVTGWTATGA